MRFPWHAGDAGPEQHGALGPHPLGRPARRRCGGAACGRCACTAPHWRACSSVRPNRGTCWSGLTPSGGSPHHDLLAPARLCASLDRAPACGAWVGALRMGASCDTAETRWTCPCPPWRMRGRGRHSRPFGTSRRRPQGAHGRVRAGAHDPADAWEWWHRVRCLCGHNAKLGVLLDLPLALPPEQYVARWRVRQRAAAPWARHVHSQ